MQINDCMHDWLSGQGVVPSHINDMWMSYFDLQGISVGAFNDRMDEFLGSRGYTGTLTDKWALWVVDTCLGSLPPNFPNPADPDENKLKVFYDGANTADGLGKVDSVLGDGTYDLEACQAPCLTLAVSDTIEAVGHGAFTSNMGTATFTYDGTDLTCTGAGTVFGLLFSDSAFYPCSEGAGTAENNLEIRSRDCDVATVTVAAGALTAWTANTQDSLFEAMDKGWWQSEPDDGIQYPCNLEYVEIGPTTEMGPDSQFGPEGVAT